MLTLYGQNIFLRALEPEDFEMIFSVENNEEFWEISTNSTPYSRYIIKQYIENSHKDIYEVKQLRLVICTNDKTPVGLIDLFNFEPKHRRVAVGIVIDNKENRGSGYGGEALKLLCNFCFAHLGLHQIYANIGIDNVPSQQLFEKAGFKKSGHKKDWNYVNGKFKDELTYQLIHNVH
ncbi:acetyltransferase [Salinimicrobium marinum]|uniref:Acetyltransferase n=1 Tax=Salinimicrobium marinum TaxID=680283 RepID=A0A918VVY5_9FLAO|nr:GNAT family protein [Salinimicrobium marinum]GHA34728.1 acetyltransferase [Salinimicrobium marinum]